MKWGRCYMWLLNLLIWLALFIQLMFAGMRIIEKKPIDADAFLHIIVSIVLFYLTLYL